MRTLPPQHLLPHYWEAVQRAIEDFFERVIFAPIRAVLDENGLDADLMFENAGPSLEDLIMSGRVHYEAGIFSGIFDARISAALKALGAVIDRRNGNFVLAEERVPATIKAAAVRYGWRIRAASEEVQRQLRQIQERMELGQMMLPFDAGAPIDAIETGFKTTAEAVGIPTKISGRQREQMERQYEENVRPYVSKATAEFIDKLHGDVERNASAGYRFEGLVSDISKRYNQSKRKARFLARQETAMFMSAYRRMRFEEAGVRRYKWSNSHDARVRPAEGLSPAAKAHAGNHRVLQGKVFYYETKAPAQYMSMKRPCNPGEDWECRCVDLPILESLDE